MSQWNIPYISTIKEHNYNDDDVDNNKVKYIMMTCDILHNIIIIIFF